MEKTKPSGNNISLIAVWVCGKAWLSFLGKMRGSNERGGCGCGVGAGGEEIMLSGSFSWATPALAGILDSQGSHGMPGRHIFGTPGRASPHFPGERAPLSSSVPQWRLEGRQQNSLPGLSPPASILHSETRNSPKSGVWGAGSIVAWEQNWPNPERSAAPALSSCSWRKGSTQGHATSSPGDTTGGTGDRGPPSHGAHPGKTGGKPRTNPSGS